MERAISVDERIKRAEDIYQRRRMQSYGTNQARVNVGDSHKNFKLFKKMFIQICICLIIYLLFYMIKNSNYIFSEAFIKQAKELLSYDINITQLYNGIVNWYNALGTGNDKTTEAVSTDEKSENSSSEENTNDTKQEDIEKEESKEENIQEKSNIEENEQTNTQTLSIAEDASSISQTATDAEIIKSNYSIIKPLTGTITSRFGVRNPTTPTVPKYHTGIDIAANTGTKFIAAMSGTVVQVSSEGDYGNHVKILKDDVATLYAHCSKIYVKEGEEVTQGQEIGEVGATGNVTGPHLHFEIRKSEQFVNPDDILDF